MAYAGCGHLSARYLLGLEQYRQLKRGLEFYFSEGSRSVYPVWNLYFDTDDFGLYRHSLETNCAQWLCMEAYGPVSESATVFVELYRRRGNALSTRKCAASFGEAFAALLGETPLEKLSRPLKDIASFSCQRGLSAQAAIGYSRESFFGTIDGMHVTTTLDQNIAFETIDGIGGMAPSRGMLLEEGQAIFEADAPLGIPKEIEGLLACIDAIPILGGAYEACLNKFVLQSPSPAFGAGQLWE